jgi:uncharacterized protein (DUF1697 family)
MTRYVAFLRGINLGKRRVKMEQLRRHFEGFGLENVDTFIASGNVVFDSPRQDRAELEGEMEGHLHEALGFFSETFLRSLPELALFPDLEVVERAEVAGFTPHLIFLKEGAGEAMEGKLRALETPDDGFHLLPREVFWFRRGGLTDSTIKTKDLEGALGGAKNTTRKLSTVRRIVAKFGE